MKQLFTQYSGVLLYWYSSGASKKILSILSLWQNVKIQLFCTNCFPTQNLSCLWKVVFGMWWTWWLHLLASFVDPSRVKSKVKKILWLFTSLMGKVRWKSLNELWTSSEELQTGSSELQVAQRSKESKIIWSTLSPALWLSETKVNV